MNSFEKVMERFLKALERVRHKASAAMITSSLAADLKLSMAEVVSVLFSS